MKAASELHSSYLQAYILSSIAFTEALDGRRKAARADVARGLALAERDPEAKGERPMLLGVLAKVAADVPMMRSAISRRGWSSSRRSSRKL